MTSRRRPIIWSPEARADLLRIWKFYVDAASRKTANNVVRRIHEACRVLEDYPLAGRARDKVRAGLRSVVASPHVVFYRVTDVGPEIVRVVDGRQDLDEVFAPRPGKR